MITPFINPTDEKHLWPITVLRQSENIRLGYFTLGSKWQLVADTISFDFSVNPLFLPTEELLEQIRNQAQTKVLTFEGQVVAHAAGATETLELPIRPVFVHRLTDLYTLLGPALEIDSRWAGKELRQTGHLADTLILGRGKNSLWMADGVNTEGATLNLTDGPIILGPQSQIMEGALVRGPFSLGAHSQIKMGAKIYGPSAIGSHCKVGGEVSNSLISDFSNKAHDGFLGNAVIGEWCNLGADTNCSNLKNNYSSIEQWTYAEDRFVNTGLQFCGVVLGDHVKTGINTMLNTGTVVGTGANVFGGGFPSKYIPDFTWGGSEKLEEYDFEKFMTTVHVVMARRSLSATPDYQAKLKAWFDATAIYRNRTE